MNSVFVPILVPLVGIAVIVGIVAYSGWLDYQYATPYERWKDRFP